MCCGSELRKIICSKILGCESCLLPSVGHSQSTHLRLRLPPCLLWVFHVARKGKGFQSLCPWAPRGCDMVLMLLAVRTPCSPASTRMQVHVLTCVEDSGQPWASCIGTSSTLSFCCSCCFDFFETGSLYGHGACPWRLGVSLGP